MSEGNTRRRALISTLSLYAAVVGAVIVLTMTGLGAYVPLALLSGAIVGSYLPMSLPPIKYDQTFRAVLDGILVSIVVLAPYVGLLYLLRQLGVFSFQATLPKNVWQVVGTQLVVIALPEEFFFRATIQAGLDQAMKPKWKLFGIEFGWGLFLGSVLFGAAHVFYQGPFGLTTAIPSLVFGLLYIKRSNVAGAAIFHACCNLVMVCFPAFSHRTFS